MPHTGQQMEQCKHRTIIYNRNSEKIISKIIELNKWVFKNFGLTSLCKLADMLVPCCSQLA